MTTKQQKAARCRLCDELVRRRLPGRGGWSHNGTQFAAEPTALALLALRTFPPGMESVEHGFHRLISHQRPDKLWSASGDSADVNLWATALVLNALMIFGRYPRTVIASLKALLRFRPSEASWLVRLKFRLSDQHIRFDPKKYGWPWVAGTVSWVLPTSMALIALTRAERGGLTAGAKYDARVRLGAEMLLDRACVGGGWNAGNSVVYGVPLRPHIDATSIALSALRLYYRHRTVRESLTWLLGCVRSLSPYSLAWLIVAIAQYEDVEADVGPALVVARDHLVTLIEDPRNMEDTSAIALSALALGVECVGNPFEVNA